MRKELPGVMPVGAPWGGPESYKLLSCFASLVLFHERRDETMTLHCDHAQRLCSRCGECGDFIWKNKCHEQIYHDFLTLSGVSCRTAWPKSRADDIFAEYPLAELDGEALRRAMDFAGYNYEVLSGLSAADQRAALVETIDGGWPLLAYRVVNADWCLAHGYERGGEVLLGSCAAEEWRDARRKPDEFAAGFFSKADWAHAEVKLARVTGKKPARSDYAEVFARLRALLMDPGCASAHGGLAAYAACAAALTDADFFARAPREELIRLYADTHAFIGLLAEARCFAAFAFLSGLFGRLEGEELLAEMTRAGSAFMDTHNQCWGAWAVMGVDYRCQPEAHLEKFIRADTRARLVEYLGVFRANDEAAIRLLEILSARAVNNLPGQ